MNHRGALVVVEGLDRSGKTTQVQRLVEHLCRTGYPAVVQSFPDRSTVTGQLIVDHLQDNVEINAHTLHLLFTANRWECVEKIQRYIEAGTTVVVDRYVYSGIAYSTARGLEYEWCRRAESGLPAADLTLFLHIPVHLISQRSGFGNERYETEMFQTAANSAFWSFFVRDNQDETLIVVDGTGTIEEIADQLYRSTTETLGEIHHYPLRSLNY